MAGLPSDVLVTKGAALLAEVGLRGFLLPFSPLLYLEKIFCLCLTPPSLIYIYIYLFLGFQVCLGRGETDLGFEGDQSLSAGRP